MQQVMAIHGGTSFDTQEEYIEFIATRDLTLDKLKQPDDWKASLANDLGSGFEVLLPKMPNATNARYKEWHIWFERCIPFMQEHIILIGHSLGGIFLAKYLSEDDFPKKVTATFLVGAPFDATSTVESLNDFTLEASLSKLEKQGGKIHLVYSKDDPVVPFEEMEKYAQALPTAQPMIFDTKGHFNQRNFPELVERITSL